MSTVLITSENAKDKCRKCGAPRSEHVRDRERVTGQVVTFEPVPGPCARTGCSKFARSPIDPKAWEKMKEEAKLVDLYLKRGGRYVAGPFEGFSRKQRRFFERMERRTSGKALRGYRARQRAAAVEEKLEEARGKAPAQKQNIVQRGAAAVRNALGGIFGRGRQKK